MKYGYNIQSKRFIGVFTDKHKLNEGLDYISIKPSETLLRPIINADKTGWIEGLTAAEIDKINTDKLIEEQKIKREKIIKEKLDKMAEEQINLNPLLNPDFYPIWTVGTYAINAIVMYKLKLFKNTVAGNINAPNKGGWTEIK